MNVLLKYETGTLLVVVSSSEGCSWTHVRKIFSVDDNADGQANCCKQERGGRHVHQDIRRGAGGGGQTEERICSH